MTAAELIAERQKVPPQTQIRVWADHGQSCMRASTAGLMTIAKRDLAAWMSDGLSPDQVGASAPDELATVFEIGAP